MQVSLNDRGALRAVTPTALSAYARALGWKEQGTYRKNSGVYVGDKLPQILVPHTQALGDYASAVLSLIETFSQISGQDVLTTYRTLITADRDTIRIRAAESDDGSLCLNEGVSLVSGGRDMVLAAACALRDARPVYNRANKDALELMESMRLGQTEQGSFVVTLLTPVISPPVQGLLEDSEDSGAPIARRMTRKLVEALKATRQAVDRLVVGNEEAFGRAARVNGVSANLCEALVQIVEPFPKLDVAISWARTRPVAMPKTVVRFEQSDAALLHEAARVFRDRAPKPDVCLHGFVHVLKRGNADADGMVKIHTKIDNQPKTISAVLEHADYERALKAHKGRAMVEMKGDLECVGQRWKLLNPRLQSVLRNDELELDTVVGEIQPDT